MFSAGVLALIVGLSSYSVPVIIAGNAGIDIVSVRIIRMLKVVYPPRTGAAVVLSAFLFLAIMAAWLLQRKSARGGNFARVGGRSARSGRFELGPWRWVARGYMAVYIGSACILPLLALIVVALQPYWTPTITFSDFGLHNFRDILFRDRISANALRFSMTLGAIGGAVGMTIAAVVVLYIHSARASAGSFVDAVTKFPGALSNIVIGVGFLFAFSGPPFNLSGTLLLLFLAYLTIYMPQASIAAGSALSQVGTELSEASYVCGAGEGRTVRSIMMPLMLPGLVNGWALLFVLMATELAASSLLAGVGNPVIGFVIIEIWSAGTYGKLAALATTVTFLSAGVIAVAFTASRWLRRGYL
jgi:iron(III) transport system permease protein